MVMSHIWSVLAKNVPKTTHIDMLCYKTRMEIHISYKVHSQFNYFEDLRIVIDVMILG